MVKNFITKILKVVIYIIGAIGVFAAIAGALSQEKNSVLLAYILVTIFQVSGYLFIKDKKKDTISILISCFINGIILGSVFWAYISIAFGLLVWGAVGGGCITFGVTKAFVMVPNEMREYSAFLELDSLRAENQELKKQLGIKDTDNKI